MSKDKKKSGIDPKYAFTPSKPKDKPKWVPAKPSPDALKKRKK